MNINMVIDALIERVKPMLSSKRRGAKEAASRLIDQLRSTSQNLEQLKTIEGERLTPEQIQKVVEARPAIDISKVLKGGGGG